MNTQDVIRAKVDPQDTVAYNEELELKTQNSKLKTFLTSPYLTIISRIVLGGIFFLSGLTKLGVPEPFAENIHSYEMNLPRVVEDAMAVGLPPLELGLGIFLILGLFTRFSAIITGVLMAIFTIAMAQAWARGLSPNCGCFAGETGNALGNALVTALGPIGTFLTNEKVGWGSITRDLIFLGMSIHLIFVPTVWALDNLRARGRVSYEEYDEESEDEAGFVEAPAYEQDGMPVKAGR